MKVSKYAIETGKRRSTGCFAETGGFGLSVVDGPSPPLKPLPPEQMGRAVSAESGGRLSGRLFQPDPHLFRLKTQGLIG